MERIISQRWDDVGGQNGKIYAECFGCRIGYRFDRRSKWVGNGNRCPVTENRVESKMATEASGHRRQMLKKVR